MTTTTDLAVFEQFVYAEVRCIDERRWDDWLKCFSDEGDYWIPLSPEDSAPGQALSILYEDKPKLRLRCERYSHPLVHSQIPPSQTSHLVSNVMLDGQDETTGQYRVTAQFIMYESRQDEMTAWTGTLKYLLVGQPDQLRIQRKKVILVNSTSQMETIQIPF